LKGNDIDIEGLRHEKNRANHACIDAQSKLEDIKSNLKVRDDIFNSGKSFEESLFQELTDANKEKTELERQKRVLQMSATEISQLKESIEAARIERDKLQHHFNDLMTKPFFKRHGESEISKELDKV
jgi:flagellar biosynthesis GTPase FlhF